MSRPARLVVDSEALLHNLERIKQYAPGKKIIAMVKANAYGCGLSQVIPVLDQRVYAFGVACIEEGLKVRALGSATEVILFQGVFAPEELTQAVQHHFTCVIHHPLQLEWLSNTPLKTKMKLWVKVNTGMNRLGFFPEDIAGVMDVLKSCPWVDKEIGLLTHMACADEPNNPLNQLQIQRFEQIPKQEFAQLSMANSATIIQFPQMHGDAVRPGIMLYGVSPFAEKTGKELGLKPVMRFLSAISAIHDYPVGTPIGYGATWKTSKNSRIGIVAIGYGDGYPRHISAGTTVAVNGHEVPIVGRVSMDMLAVDLSACPSCQIGDEVELWGIQIPVEKVAEKAGTLGYELLCQIAERVKR